MNSLIIISYVVLAVTYLITLIVHHIERKDLYDRLMAYDLKEYENFKHPSPKIPRESAHREQINKWKGGE